jgi:1-deoxy-D-xylulose-5-phosphate synthase
MGGLHPVVAIYSTFLNRAFDQTLMDVAMHKLPVTFVLDRAGITGPDGASHHGMWDLSLLQLVPGMRVAVPRDATRLTELLNEAVAVSDGPTALRFPRGSAPADVPTRGKLGGMDLLREPSAGESRDVLLVGVGVMAGVCAQTADRLAAQGIGVTVVDPRWVKPLDEALAGAAAEHQLVAVVEDSGRAGGTGDAVARLLRDRDVDVPIRTFGIEQEFLEHGDRPDLLADQGLEPQQLARVITGMVAGRTAELASEHQS